MLYTSRHPSHRPIPPLDFSAMSALGLMLVNFFMLQQMWEKPQVMPLVVPAHHDGCMDCEDVSSKFIPLTLLCAYDKVYVYTGITEPQLDSVSYSAAGLRQAILNRKQKTDAEMGLENYMDCKSGVSRKGSFISVLIKPLPSATYGSIVDVLDEMHICGVRYYLLQEPALQEIDFINSPKQGLKFSPE